MWKSKGDITVRSFLGLSMSLSLISGTVALANEIDGFRLGMSMAKVRQLAIEKGYTFSDPLNMSDGSVSYSLQKDGPALWFCDATLIGVDLYRPSSLREIMNTFKDWKSAYGEPLVLPKTYFREGTQISQILFKWLGEDNIERRILMAQFDQTQTGMAFSYSYIKHPCNKGPG